MQEAPPPIPRTIEAIRAEVADCQERVDYQILQADEAQIAGRLSDCTRWLDDARATIVRIQACSFELDLALRMKTNHD